MSVESPITSDHNWFKGEMKVLRFTVDGVSAADPIAGWAMEWTLNSRRSKEGVLYKGTATGGIVGSGSVADVTIQASDTFSLPEGSYNYVLRRTDAGNEGVLAYGPAVLRDAPGAGS